MFDNVTLAEFARSLVARARIDSIDRPTVAASIPRGPAHDDLYAAAVASHDRLEALSSRIDAELGVAIAALERIERENSVLRGQINQLLDYDKARRADFQRALQDTRDTAEACVERFTQTLLLREPTKA